MEKAAGRIVSLRRAVLLGSATTVIMIGGSGAAVAQNLATSSQDSERAERGANSASPMEIVVTARKRAESLQDVPVVVTAFDTAAIERNAVAGTEDLSRITPGLVVYATGNTAAQGTVSLRGIQTGSINLASDQAVALNIDGVQIESGLGMKAGLFDLQQIEVMKGPQALYFGKNSTGGVIAFRTADPTNELLIQARGGYEFNAREKYGQLIVSGPITDSLGGRAAFSYSDMDGWLVNTSPTAVSHRVPNAQDLIARGTLLWRPTSDFDARLKLTYAKYKADQYAYSQKIACFRPAPGGTAAECELNKKISQSAPLDPLGRYDSDDPYADLSLHIASLDLNHEISSGLSLSSTSAYYRFEQRFFDSVLPRAPTDTFNGAPNQILNEEADQAQSFSQELRLTSAFDGPLNFMVGAYFDDRKVQSDVALQFSLTPNPRTEQKVNSSSYSVFGQLSFDVLRDLELAAGLRYTNEKREYDGILLEAAGTSPAGTRLIPLDDKLEQSNYSPEVSLTWRPSSSLTLFAAYKEGFKSGSFDISPTNNIALARVPREIRFNSESAEGFEAGFKTLWFDRQLRINGAAYHYEYTGLQMNSFDPSTAATRVINAGGATTKGAEIEAQFAPRSIDGLVINASVVYNRARYDEFVTDCNQTQLTTATCPLDLRAPLGAESQDLAGKPLRMAPRWAASGGISLDRSLNATMNYRVGVNVNYTSSYQTEERGEPLGIQSSYATVNANLGVGSENGRWSVDLLGTNLTDKLFRTTSNSQPFSGGGGFRQDYFATITRGREIRLQLTLRN